MTLIPHPFDDNDLTHLGFQRSQIIDALFLNAVAELHQALNDPHPLPRRDALIAPTLQISDHLIRREDPCGTRVLVMKLRQLAEPNPSPFKLLLLGSNFRIRVHHAGSVVERSSRHRLLPVDKLTKTMVAPSFLAIVEQMLPTPVGRTPLLYAAESLQRENCKARNHVFSGRQARQLPVAHQGKLAKNLKRASQSSASTRGKTVCNSPSRIAPVPRNLPPHNPCMFLGHPSQFASDTEASRREQVCEQPPTDENK